MRAKIFFHLGFLTALASVSGAWAGPCTVDASATSQVIRGFGAASAWNFTGSLSPWAQVLWAVDGQNGHVGLSMLRTRIAPNDPGSGVSWIAEAGPMTLAKSANPNLIIWSSEWTPPNAEKNDGTPFCAGCTVGFCSCSNNTFTGAASGAANAGDTGYADYLTRYLQYIQGNFGVTLYAVSPQNEPDWNPDYESALWSAGQFDAFVPALAASITGAGLSTRIMIPESFSDNLSLASATMNDAVAAPLVGILAGHLYGGGPNDIHLTGWSHLTNQENWETEISDVSGAGNDPTMQSGLKEANWIFKSLVNGNMNAYHHWWIYGPDNSALITSGGTTKKLMVIGNYSKFVRPGYYRMGATTVPSAGVSVTAFKDTNNSSPATFVIVAINANNAATSQTFNLNSLTTYSITPWLTDPNNDLVQQAAVPVSADSFTYSLPVSSVVSFVAINNPPTPTPTFTPCGYPGNTCTPTVTPTPTNTPIPKGPVVAAPNVLRGSQSWTIFRVPESGATLKISIYDMAGETIASGSGAAGSSQGYWDSTGTASGLYLARVTVNDPDGTSRGQTLKLLVVH